MKKEQKKKPKFKVDQEVKMISAFELSSRLWAGNMRHDEVVCHLMICGCSGIVERVHCRPIDDYFYDIVLDRYGYREIHTRIPESYLIPRGKRFVKACNIDMPEEMNLGDNLIPVAANSIFARLISVRADNFVLYAKHSDYYDLIKYLEVFLDFNPQYKFLPVISVLCLGQTKETDREFNGCLGWGELRKLLIHIKENKNKYIKNES